MQEKREGWNPAILILLVLFRSIALGSGYFGYAFTLMTLGLVCF